MHNKIPAGAATVTAALLALLLTGCYPGNPDAVYQNYLQRLGRTLDMPAPAVSPGVLPPRPRPGDIKLAITPGKLDALDFLAISGCAVQVTIGKRNSSLGRMAKPSQRLLLELEYLELAPECITYQRQQGRTEIADTLQEAWLLKRQQLPALIFNATLGSPEYRSFWRANAVDSSYPENSGSSVITALEAINVLAGRWLAGNYRADNLQFELHLSEIAAGDGGTLLAALGRQNNWLEAADRLLAQRMDRGPLCSGEFRPDAAQILPNVISKYFIGEIQPLSAALGQRFHQLLPPLAQLETAVTGVLPPAYLEWQRQRDTLLDKFYTAPRRHVEKVQAVLAPCEQNPATTGDKV